MTADPRADFPLGSRRPDLVATPSGVRLDELTLDALREGRIAAADMRATPETLHRQGNVARASGRPQLAASLDRAAELATVPDDVVLAIYTALRPGRATGASLAAWADRLEGELGAPATAEFVREALAVYQARGLLARDEP